MLGTSWLSFGAENHLKIPRGVFGADKLLLVSVALSLLVVVVFVVVAKKAARCALGVEGGDRGHDGFAEDRLEDLAVHPAANKATPNPVRLNRQPIRRRRGSRYAIYMGHVEQQEQLARQYIVGGMLQALAK